MSPKKILYIAVAVIMFMFLAMVRLSYVQIKTFKRDERGLITRYLKLKKNHPIASIKTLKILLKRNPHHLFALETLAKHYEAKSYLELALSYRQQIEKIDPEDPDNLLAMAVLYDKQEKMDESYHYIKASLATSKDNYVFYTKMLLELNNITSKTFWTRTPVLNVLKKTLSTTYDYWRIDSTEMRRQILAVFAPYTLSPLYTQNSFHNAGLFRPNNSSVDYIEREEASWSFDALPSFPFDTVAQATSDNSLLSNHASAPNDMYAQLEKYYRVKKYNNALSYQLIKQLIKQSPKEVKILREAGESAIANHHLREAELFLKNSYALAPSDELALELGYLSQQLGHMDASLGYFNKAKKSKNKVISKKAEKSIGNINPWQSKLLPSPYYGEIYFAPFYFSRFSLAVAPVIARVGKELNTRNHLKVYFITRYTKDDRSGIFPRIDDIYEDNLFTYALGVQIQPIRTLPMIGFLEAGRARDLIWRRRDRNSNDLRGGLTYGDGWQNIVSNPMKKGGQLILDGELYANAIYYSRYNDDLITFGRLRENLTLIRYKKAALKFYLMAQGSVDTNRYFYNNIFEWGPGFSLHLTNKLRVNVEKRFGYYLPVNSPTVNPYNKTYLNDVWQLNLFVTF
jgi:hypothetical protein